MTRAVARTNAFPRRLRLRKGLDLPLAGAPEQLIEEGPAVHRVAFVAADFPGLRPSVLVESGQRVTRGQPLVADRDRPEVRHVSPGGGRVVSIAYGARRALEAIVIALDPADEEPRAEDAQVEALSEPTRERVVARLLSSGLWTALRARPFGGVARPAETPRALFVTALDTRPLAADPALVIAAGRQAFSQGLTALGHLLDGPLFLCTAPGADVPAGESDRVTRVEVSGPHPAGLVGTHIHHLAPASPEAPVWHVGYQDVIAMGHLFATGCAPVERVVALAGPRVRRPRLVRTRLGASTADLLPESELLAGPCRVVSGSVLDGRRASGPTAFLGRYHVQVCAVPDAEVGPARVGGRGWSYHSLLDRLRGAGRGARFDTSRHGPRGPLLTLPTLDRVMPLDILPAPLLRALLVGDDEAVEALGGFELEEEDLALCAFLCPGKIDWGRLLRAALARHPDRI